MARPQLILTAALLLAACTGKDIPHYETAKIDRGKVIAKVTATGTLSAHTTVQVGAQVSGRIAELKVDFNSEVKKNDVLARIDPQLFQAALEQAKANDMQAKAQTAKAKVQAVDAERQYNRAKQLREQNLIAQADLDTAQANNDAAKAGVDAAVANAEQSKASLHQAQVNLDYTTIFSPIDGTVITRNVDVGQTVASALQAPTLFVIAQDLRAMQVDTSVAEADVGRLEAGMNVTFVVDAYPSERFKGTVRQIRFSPQTVQNVVTYDAVIDVENPELKLRPGMTANVTFVSAERDNVLRVPNAALRFRPPPELMAGKGGGRDGGWAGGGHRGQGGQGGPGGPGGERAEGGEGKEQKAIDPSKKMLWVLDNGQLKPRRVNVGVTDGSMTELVEAGELSEGSEVVTEVTGIKSAGGPQPGMGGGMRRMF
ncbi:MAG: efflux RND transporter periplasmic adaptor subunit [Myxococcaceae bacterium]